MEGKLMKNITKNILSNKAWKMEGGSVFFTVFEIFLKTF